jgi:hypothetical protein
MEWWSKEVIAILMKSEVDGFVIGRAGPEAVQPGPQPRASRFLGPHYFFFKPITYNIS